jgi:hypothetical protein
MKKAFFVVRKLFSCKISALLLGTLLWMMNSTGFAAECIVVGSGTTENAALQDVFRKALESTYGVQVESSTYVINSILINDRTHSHTSGHIKKYEILKKEVEDDLYFIKARVFVEQNADTSATVSADKVKEQQAQMFNAHIGILVLGQSPGKQVVDATAESTIANSLRAAGFSQVTSISQLPSASITNTGLNKNTVAPETIFSQQPSFDYILKATMIYNSIPTGFTTQVPIESINAALTATIIKGDTNDLLEECHYEASGVDISKTAAVESAAYKVGESAGDDLAKKLLTYANKASDHYTLYISHLKNFTSLSLFKESLSCLPEATNISIRSYADNAAIIDLDFDGDNQSLAFYITQTASGSAIIDKISNHAIYLTVQ